MKLLKIILFFLIFVKVSLTFFFERELSGQKLILQSSVFTKINNDERAYSTVAYNFNHGLGFSYTSKEDNFYFGSDTPPTRPTAYRPTFPVLIHIIYQKLFFADIGYVDVIDKDSSYLKSYAFIVKLISIVFFLISIPFFKTLSANLSSNIYVQHILTLVYILFPSSLIFIGLIPSYENITLPLFVIVLSKLHVTIKYDIKPKNLIILPVITALIILLRPHMTISLFLIFTYGLLSLFKYYNKKKLQILLFTLIIVLLSNGLILLKNYYVIGAPVLTTQQGRVFFLGNNPYAKGSWNGNATKPDDPMFIYRKDNILNFTTTTDELYLSKEHSRLAKEWIQENPFDFLILSMKKIAMHFLPYNYEHLKFNIVNFIVNIGTFLCLILFCFRFKCMTSLQILLTLSLFGAFLMCIFSFFNFRFMYYTYPIYILLSFYLYNEIFKLIKIKWLKSSR